MRHSTCHTVPCLGETGAWHLALQENMKPVLWKHVYYVVIVYNHHMSYCRPVIYTSLSLNTISSYFIPLYTIYILAYISATTYHLVTCYIPIYSIIPVYHRITSYHIVWLFVCYQNLSYTQHIKSTLKPFIYQLITVYCLRKAFYYITVRILLHSGAKSYRNVPKHVIIRINTNAVLHVVA